MNPRLRILPVWCQNPPSHYLVIDRVGTLTDDALNELCRMLSAGIAVLVFPGEVDIETVIDPEDDQ